jgi:hypothetical protein
MGDVRVFGRAVDEVANGVDVQAFLEGVAGRVVDAAQGQRGTSKLRFRTRSGEGPRGAFAQAIMYGEGAVAIEFGTRRTPPLSPLRSAMRRVT